MENSQQRRTFLLGGYVGLNACGTEGFMRRKPAAQTVAYVRVSARHLGVDRSTLYHTEQPAG
ncbi:hypothetical protein SPF06_19795 [Sinomonas sp. JGH33]|uniref:Transposase n=1 Tax=Sinomonas terricola TaxID=3110330 RepID=A0ABU5TBR2_9MICC|nr:hypothetical protein [Sinomonas sp. JGH33]MEA5456972.1 hypothetical protein [Sinomonas sp. JGH33]